MTWEWCTCGWMEFYVEAGLEREKAAILVVMAALSDGRKVVVSAIPGYRESTESWSDVLRDMRRRGLECPRLVIGDGHLGSSAQRLSSGGRATLLEPQDPKRTGQASKATAGLGQTHAAYHPLRPDSDRG